MLLNKVKKKKLYNVVVATVARTNHNSAGLTVYLTE